MLSPRCPLLVALPLLATAACDFPTFDPRDELEGTDLGQTSSELIVGTLAYNTPVSGRLYASGRFAYHWYSLDTEPGDSLQLRAEFRNAQGFVTFAKRTGDGVSFDLCPDGRRNGCQSLEVRDRGQYVVLATTAARWYRGIPTSAVYGIEVVAETARPCGARGLPECGEDEFCSFSREANCGATDYPGVCEPIPEACIELFQPVEGCDGVVYCNECYAAAWGVSVVREVRPGTLGEVECSFPGEEPFPPLDRPCSTENPCGEGETCDYSGLELRECPETYDGLEGVCQDPRVTLCPGNEQPVCGCDGETYGNRCLLSIFGGVVVASSGECP